MASDLTIGFLGAGQMAAALAKGFVRSGLLPADRILASDPSESARARFAQTTGARVAASNLDVLCGANVIVLAVKPAQVLQVLDEIKPAFTPAHLLISIAAGVKLAKLEGALSSGARVVRVMPNTPALVGSSASAFSLGQAASTADGELARRLFCAVGEAHELKETLLDAVTGLSGSGPAYVYLIIEALSDGGVAAGLPREVSLRLAAQTVLGAAKMVLDTGLHPGALKDMVTSPAGTTIDGLHELERSAVRGALIQAVRVAADKSRQLGSR